MNSAGFSLCASDWLFSTDSCSSPDNHWLMIRGVKESNKPADRGREKAGNKEGSMGGQKGKEER